MIRRPPRSTPLYSSAASDVYKRQAYMRDRQEKAGYKEVNTPEILDRALWEKSGPVSYTHLRAHET